MLKHAARDDAIFHDEMKKLEIKVINWQRYNITLLETLFGEREIVAGYKRTGGTPGRAWDEDILEWYDRLAEDLKKEIAYLDSCIERLHFFEEPIATDKVFEPGQTFDAFISVQNILREAQRSITLVDSYVDEQTLGILAGKPQGVGLTILTKAASMKPAFKAAINAFVHQHGEVNLHNSENFHDRFIIVDATKVYLSGTSLNHIGKRACTIIRMEQESLVQVVLNMVETELKKPR